ncbi:MAG TPA: mechanosensitive ion channel family protein, partial [Cyanophyceae cyanobacterium]
MSILQLNFSSWTIASSLVLAGSIGFPVQAQLPVLGDLNLPTPNLFNQAQNNPIVSDCIRLDGRCLFQVADQRSELPDRIQSIEQRLQDISRIYFTNDEAKLKLRKQQEGKLPDIYVSAGDREVRLLSVTAPDADLEGVDLDTRADQIIGELEQGLRQAKQERRPKVLTRRGGIAAGTGVVMIVASLAISYGERRLKRSKHKLSPTDSSPTQPISSQLIQKQQWNVKEVQHRLFQLVKAGILGGG